MMTCRSCGQAQDEQARFCNSCGARLLTGPAGTANSVHEARVTGSIYQAGGDITVAPSVPDEQSARYTVKWHWASPLTQSVLGWASLALGIVSLAGGASVFAPLIRSLNAGRLAPSTEPWALAVFLVCTAGAVVAFALRRVAKHETQHVGPSFLPALTGWNHRLGLARFTGECPTCRGGLRFYNKPLQWLVHADGSRGKVIERAMVAECERSDKHWWFLDSAEPVA